MTRGNPEYEECQYHAYMAGPYDPQLVRSSPQYLALVTGGWVEVECEVMPVEEGQVVTLHFKRYGAAPDNHPRSTRRDAVLRS
jgi:hypothetical protein